MTDRVKNSVRKQIIVFWFLCSEYGRKNCVPKCVNWQSLPLWCFFLTMDGGGAQIGGGVASLIHEKVRSKMKILTIFEEPTKIIESGIDGYILTLIYVFYKKKEIPKKMRKHLVAL